jgi:regulator of replication initiation timing
VDNLESKLEISKNFKNYRTIMDNVTPPCIPYLGMYQKDLLFLDDGNPNMIENLINFNKRMKMADVIFDLGFCQIGSFPTLSDIQPVIISWIFNSVNLSEKELYLCSRRVDPKDPEMVISELITLESEYLIRIAELEAELEEEKKENERLRSENERLRGATSEGGGCLEEVRKKETEVVIEEKPTPPVEITHTPPEVKEVFTPENKKREGGKGTQGRLRRQGRVLKLLSLSEMSNLDPYKWSVDDVCEWVVELVGVKWKEPFHANQILGADLMEMSVTELSIFVDDWGVCTTIYSALQRLDFDSARKRREAKAGGDGEGK